MGPKSFIVTSVFTKKKKKRGTFRPGHTEKKAIEAEIGMVPLQAEENQRLLGATEEAKKFLPWNLKRVHGLANNLILDL